MTTSMTGAGGFAGRTGGMKDRIPSGYQKGQIAQFTPEQMQLFQQLLGGIGPGLQGGLSNLSKLAAGDESYFQQLEAPALRQFGQLQGQTASRFSGQGLGGRRSSAFQNTMGGAAADLAERLQASRVGLQQNAIQQLLGLSGSLLSQRPYETALAPKQKPFWQELLLGLSPGVGSSLGSAGSLWGMNKFGLI